VSDEVAITESVAWATPPLRGRSTIAPAVTAPSMLRSDPVVGVLRRARVPATLEGPSVLSDRAGSPVPPLVATKVASPPDCTVSRFATMLEESRMPPVPAPRSKSVAVPGL
jgi:hypothetical protein